jgi:hypothetical protein
MTLTQATNKAEKTEVTMTELNNGQYSFTRNNRTANAWLENGVFDLASKIYTNGDSDILDTMNKLFKYLTK